MALEASSYHSMLTTRDSAPEDLKPLPPTKYALGRGDVFPTERRPEVRELSQEGREVINEWFELSKITIGPKADTPARIEETKRLLYTWRECFAESVRDIKATDIIEHSIDLEPNAKPVKGTLPKYTAQEREFANTIFPAMEDAGIIVRRSSAWGARTKFPPKKKGSTQLRVVHNFIPVNSHTIKSQYPVHRLEEVVDILIKPEFTVYFTSDAANSYWGIPMRITDINKTGFLTPNGQWVYLRMGQGLKGAAHTYSQFSDLVFGPLPANGVGVGRMPTILGTRKDTAFSVYMDDHAASARTFDSMFEFLHRQYFPRVIFGPVYLSGHKTVIMGDNLDLLGFQGTPEGLRPSLKHREKIINWPNPTNRAELDAFLWLTPFLRIFIPGRAEHVLKLKEAYLVEVPAEPKPKKPHDDEIEECDKDLTKKRPTTRSKKPTIQRKWAEKDSFDWGPSQQESFNHIKESITNNAMAGADPAAQYHLATDASKRGVGGVLFQLKGVPTGTEATPKLLPNERIVMFLSFRLEDAETRYSNSERECLAVVKCLAEVKWLVIGNNHPVMIYSDHEALKSIFSTGNTDQARIAGWMDRLGEYDLKLAYRSSRDQHIGIADGLSRMPTRLTSITRTHDEERLAMATSVQEPGQRHRSHTSPIGILASTGDSRIDKYRTSPMYERLVEFLQKGIFALEGLDRNRRRQIIRKSKRFILTSTPEIPALKYEENNGSFSLCIIESEVPRFLKAAHEDHGHYAAALTLDFLIGRAYWPNRVKDVYNWCQSCHACQMKAHRPIKADVQPIQVFEPMAMVGMDWLGPVTPADLGTGAAYVLLVVDYFSRFIWAKAYQFHTATEVVDMFQNHIAPIFGMPATVYSDNGSHFVNKDVRGLFREHGVVHYTGPITSPSSTGLLERAVQEMIGYLRTRSVEKGNTFTWNADVKDGTFFMNTKSVRIHGYSPSELMLGYEPQKLHFDTKLIVQPVTEPEGVQRMEIEEAPAHQRQIYLALRNERRQTARELTSYVAYHHSKRNRVQRLPEAGDLVIVRHHAVDNQRGRKLESRWLGPRLLVNLTPSGNSGHVQELHGDGATKRYHLNDILLYKERETFQKEGVTFEPGPRGTHPMVINGRGTGNPGSRAVLLSIYSF